MQNKKNTGEHTLIRARLLGTGLNISASNNTQGRMSQPTPIEPNKISGSEVGLVGTNMTGAVRSTLVLSSYLKHFMCP